MAGLSVVTGLEENEGRLDYPVVSLEEYVLEFLKECFFGHGLGDAISVSTKYLQSGEEF